MTIPGYVPPSGETRTDVLSRAIRDAIVNGASQADVAALQTDVTALQGAFPVSSTDNAAARFNGATGKPLQDSALIIADTTASLSRSGNGGIPVQGSNTNDDAAAGYIGEYLTASVAEGSAISVTTGANTNITSLSLTAGDWDVEGWTWHVNTNGATVTTIVQGWISTTSATRPSPPQEAFAQQQVNFTGSNQHAIATGSKRLSLSTTTTVYLSAQSQFTTSTHAIYGLMRARRVR